MRHILSLARHLLPVFFAPHMEIPPRYCVYTHRADDDVSAKYCLLLQRKGREEEGICLVSLVMGSFLRVRKSATLCTMFSWTEVKLRFSSLQSLGDSTSSLSLALKTSSVPLVGAAFV